MQCSQCEETITHPICEECISEQMASFLFEEEQPLEDLHVMKKAVKTISPVTTCVLCSGTVHVCRHCFSEEMRSNIDENLEEAFDRQFDYSLEGF